MKRRLILIGVCQLVIFNYIIGQTDFLPGYIIKPNLDTVRGTINSRNFHTNSMFCEFKMNGSNEVVRYTPDDLFAYRISDGKYYIAKDLNGQRVFLEYVIKGKLNIYFYQDDRGVGNYYASRDSMPLTVLDYSSEIREVDGVQMLYESKDYIRKLNYYTADCPQLSSDIALINKPDQRNLIRIVEKYQKLTCKDEKCIVFEKRVGIRVKWSMYYGTIAGFKNDWGYPHYPNYDSWGVNLLFGQPQFSKRLYLGIGFFNEEPIVDSPDKFYHSEYPNKKNRCYRFPVSITYIHPKKGFSPTFSYQLNMDRLILQDFNMGIMYQAGGMAVSLVADLKTEVVVLPYGGALLFGLTFDL
jgi:hypothetical protein